MIRYEEMLEHAIENKAKLEEALKAARSSDWVVVCKTDSEERGYDPLSCLNMLESLSGGRVKYNMFSKLIDTPKMTRYKAEEFARKNPERCHAMPYEQALKEGIDKQKDIVDMWQQAVDKL